MIDVSAAATEDGCIYYDRGASEGKPKKYKTLPKQTMAVDEVERRARQGTHGVDQERGVAVGVQGAGEQRTGKSRYGVSGPLSLPSGG